MVHSRFDRSHKDCFCSAIRGPKRKSENQNMSMRETGMDRIDSAEDIASMGLSDEEKYLRVTACELPSSC